MEEMLVKIGLTDLQAKAYLWMLQHGSSAPPRLAKELKITRTNAYKVLDGLVDFGLASKSETQRKLSYSPKDPSALSSIVAEERNKVIALEQNTKEAVFSLRRKFQQASAQADVKTHKGQAAVKAIYEHQASLKQPTYFIKSRADIPVMGFETMDYVRKLAKNLGFMRFGITQDAPEAPRGTKIDKQSNLARTWVSTDDYTAPVEWTVAGDELNIIIFDDQPQALQIKNKAVAEGFTQIWKLLDKSLRADPEYKNLPKNAGRSI